MRLSSQSSSSQPELSHHQGDLMSVYHGVGEFHSTTGEYCQFYAEHGVVPPKVKE